MNITITDLFGFVYVFGSKKHGFFKIGGSTDPVARMRTFIPFLPFSVEMIHTIDADNWREGEKALHRLFKAERIHNEWFTLDEYDIAAILRIEQFKDSIFEDGNGNPMFIHVDPQERQWLNFLYPEGQVSQDVLIDNRIEYETGEQ